MPPPEPDFPTPFLERLKPMPAPVRDRCGRLDAMSLAAFTLVLASLAARTVLPQLAACGPCAVAMFAGALVACSAIHEFGHLAAGLAAGFRFLALRSWPLTISARGRRLDIEFDVTVDRSHTTMVPGSSSDARRYALLALGGPLASLLAAFTAFAVLRGRTMPLEGSWLAWIAFVSFGAVCASLLPIRRGGAPSDGAQACDALARNARWLREAAFGKLLRARLNGTRFDDDGETALDDALSLDDVSRRAFGANSIAWTARSPRDRQQALRYVEEMIRCSGYATPHERAHLQAQCVILTGWYGKRRALAYAWAAGIDRTFATPSDRLRVAAVLAALDGDYLSAVRNVEALLDDAVTDASERDEVYEKNMGLWIAQLRAMAEQDGEPARIAVAAG